VSARRVHLVLAHVPAAADDAARREVEEGAGPAHLDLLPPRQPEAPLDERVLEHDRDVLVARVEVGGAREGEGEADEARRLEVDEQRARRGAAATGRAGRTCTSTTRTGAPLAEADAERVAGGEVVRLQPGRRERVRHVGDVAPLAQPDHVGEVVDDDAVAVAVELVVVGQHRGVAHAHHHLPRLVGRAPVDLGGDLRGLHHARRPHHEVAHLAEEGERAAGGRAVAAQRAVGELRAPQRVGAVHEGERGGVVPRGPARGARGLRRGGTGGGNGGRQGDEHPGGRPGAAAHGAVSPGAGGAGKRWHPGARPGIVRPRAAVRTAARAGPFPARGVLPSCAPRPLLRDRQLVRRLPHARRRGALVPVWREVLLDGDTR
jgi:hypothetical protein